MNEFEEYIQIGKYAKQIKLDLFSFFKIKSKFTDLEIVNYIEKKIKEKYNLAFPAIIGFRNIITHNTATNLENLNFIEPMKEIIRIDFGLENKGFIIDNAYTYNLCNDKAVSELINLFEIVFNKIELLKPGDKYNKIGWFVEQEILKKNNYYLLSFLCGHGVSRNNIHANPEYIYNFYSEDFTDILKIGDVFCVEPFISIDKLKIKLTNGNIFKKDIICCERWGYTRQNTVEIYEKVESKSNARVIHIENQFYVTAQGCYKLT